MEKKIEDSRVSISRRDLFKTAAIGAAALTAGKYLGPAEAHAAVQEGKWLRADENWVMDAAKYKKKPPYRIALFCSYLEGTCTQPMCAKKIWSKNF
jgi:hypothetical protein